MSKHRPFTRNKTSFTVYCSPYHFSQGIKKGSQVASQVVDKVPLREFVYNVITKQYHFFVLVIDEPKLDILRRSKNARNMTFLIFEDFKTQAQHLSIKSHRELLLFVLPKLSIIKNNTFEESRLFLQFEESCGLPNISREKDKQKPNHPIA